MIYRVTNSRDSALPRGMSRAEFQNITEPSIASRIQRAKDSVKERHDFKSEINNEYANVAHHILLKHEHGDFAAERENLIVLTQTSTTLKLIQIAILELQILTIKNFVWKRNLKISR